jgi:hypothetical protein
MSQLAILLKKVGFESKLGGMVRNGSETFVAGIVRGDQTVRYIWVILTTSDHSPKRLLTSSIQAAGASPLHAAEWSTQQMRICPL